MLVCCRHILFLLLLLLVQTSCNRPADNMQSGQRNDSLYHCINESKFISKSRLDELVAHSRAAVGNEAFLSNAEAYAATMAMDYKRACVLYDSVIAVADDEFDRLEANIGMMRLCNRVSANREFYDYRANARRSMRRINSEEESLLPSQKERLNMLELDYHIVSANYFAALGLYDEYKKSADAVAGRLTQVTDTATMFYAGLVTSASRSNTLSERFSTLYRGATRSGEYKWLAGHYKLMLATMLREKYVSDSIQKLSPGRLARLNSDTLPTEELPRWLVERAIDDFQDYGDRYMVIKSLAVLASCHVYNGEYDDALDACSDALDGVNAYYREYYGCTDTLPAYALFQPEDSLELKRMALSGVVNIPECMLLIRNEISCAYAALGDKEASDMNRNSCLDLLRVTRQNREIESRLQTTVRSVGQISRWAVILSILLVFTIVVSVVLVRRWRARNRRYATMLLGVLKLCRELATFPVNHEFADENDVNEALTLLLHNSFANIICGVRSVAILSDEPMDDATDFLLRTTSGGRKEFLRVVSSARLGSEQRTFVELLLPYIRVAKSDAERLVNMGDERTRLEELNLSYALNLARHKRGNVLKRASLSVAKGIKPYMDRLANELRMLALNENKGVTSGERLSYIAELTDKIEEYNIILERWIKLRRGELNLTIENFALQGLFDIIAKGEQAFAMKGLTLNVVPTDAVVKADKALTLFMINTLADNAAKFTPAGGVVELSAVERDDCVEVAVKDSGVGLSAEDVRMILDEKVYDASSIGRDGGDDALKNKGSGFGLMNCKGIIEKYKKTDALFSVCRMNVESRKGSGSRFSFRLPKGVMRMIMLLLISFPAPLFAAEDLQNVTSLADSVYLSNVDGDYNRTLHYARRVMDELNAFYRKNGGSGDTLALYGRGEAAEAQWWREGFSGDSLVEEIFYNMLDVRNEAAVAMLVLQQWDGYRYNNNAYTSLYRLVHEDKELEIYYINLRHIANVRQATVVLCVAVLLILIVASLLYYFKNCVINRMNLYMALEVNRRLLKRMNGKSVDSAQLLALFARELLDATGEPFRVSAVRVDFYDAAHGGVATAFAGSSANSEKMEFLLDKAYKKTASVVSADGKAMALPLLVSGSDGNRCVGAMVLESDARFSANERMTLEIIAGYVATVGYHATVDMAREYRNFDELVEESERIRYEENMLHVQNQVMDNCLSMIKHETIYYPNRIRELVERMNNGENDAPVSTEKILAMRELMDYYSTIYGILTTCATNQLDDTAFTPQRISFAEVAAECAAAAMRRVRRSGLNLTIECADGREYFYGDKELVCFLLESLFDELIAVRLDGKLTIRAIDNKDTLLVELLDARRHIDSETMAAMFVPSALNLGNDGDGVTGTGFLVAKEIVRIHEDYMGLYGGRMEAVAHEEGTLIRFTLPK
ncbi:MAG: DUF5113 domain-containing protein [Bacteroidaceae bacterium]|nr:DUF5113 domain-containing protein [Bacteroidaceae bacterium]